MIFSADGFDQRSGKASRWSRTIYRTRDTKGFSLGCHSAITPVALSVPEDCQDNVI
jgi:hypothetical protein